jgi:hypothetical protein
LSLEVEVLDSQALTELRRRGRTSYFNGPAIVNAIYDMIGGELLNFLLHLKKF